MIIELNHTMDTMFGASTIKEDNWKTMVFINVLQHYYYTPIYKSLKALVMSTKLTVMMLSELGTYLSEQCKLH